MHKNKKALKLKTGNAGKMNKTGKAGITLPAQKKTTKRVRKPLTAAQRARKNRKDRERRAQQKANRAAATKLPVPVSAPVPPVSRSLPAPCRSAKSGVSCVGSCPAGGCQHTASTKSVDEFFRRIGRFVVQAIAEAGEDVLQDFSVSGQPLFREIETGVSQGSIRLPNGQTARVTVVDGEKVDPLSTFSPLTPDVRRHLLLSRMADEISELVDSRLPA